MLQERPVHAEVRDLLVSGEPFSYAYLVKFERPSRPNANGVVSTAKERYTYLTDGSQDINFDDGSVSNNGAPNGEQVYLANKVLRTSAVSEQTQARANNFSLTLDGNGIGAEVTANVVIAQVDDSTWDIAWPKTVNLIAEGFREGDKVTFSGLRLNDFNIQSFRANNVLRVKRIDSSLNAGSGALTMRLSSEEIKSILLNKNAEDYASFINREVFIYRAYIQHGAKVGSPELIFKGIISNVGFEESETEILVTWGLTSHWGDFAQVRGRITSDDFHRALDQTGTPQPQSALKTAYAYDKGFSHSETSVNILASYQVQVERQDVSVKKGFLGIGSKVKVKKYFVNEGRNTELDFQLQAKSIPVIYGVRRVAGLPIFADTLNNDSSKVIVAYAISEGEIGGLYDMSVEGNSLICGDKSDFDARSTQNTDQTVDIVCRGRADRGDVLGGALSTAANAEAIDYYYGNEYLYKNLDYNYTMYSNYRPYVPPVATYVDYIGKGIVDGESINLTSPQNITVDFFSGKPGQKASSYLVDIARQGNFKIQNSYWSGTDTAEYWGPNHRLIDTAYVVVTTKIAEGETTVPNLEFIARGKMLNCYNYDYSYLHNPLVTGENADNFALGDIVNLVNPANSQVINTNVQIIDKWSFANSDGSVNTRFRFSEIPNLGYNNEGVPMVRSLRMERAGHTWSMVTYNYNIYSGVIPTTIAAPVTGVANVGGYTAIQHDPIPSSGGDPIELGGPIYSLLNTNEEYFSGNQLFSSDRVFSSKVAQTTSFTTRITYDNSIHEAIPHITDNTQVVSRNTLVLGSDANFTEAQLKDQTVNVRRYDAITDKETIQEKRILSYEPSSRTVTIDDVWDLNFFPKAGDTVWISPRYADKRVSINPAVQALDYITAKTYGKGLDPVKDLYLPSWLESARVCDTRSNVTIKFKSGNASTGAIYRWPASGPLLWQGRVVGSEGTYTEFTDVIGKLSHQWNSWRNFSVNELMYHNSAVYRVTSAGVRASAPTHSSGNIGGLEYLTEILLTKVSGSGTDTMSTVTDGNPVRAEKNGVRIPGYSLYDCDEVNYWRYLGWDEFSQRYVTQHQTNLSIDTSLPLFDNMNSLLEHFGGMLSYIGGKYYLGVEQPEGLIDPESIKIISQDDIIGKIRLTDEGSRSAVNSLTVGFADPGTKFESRNISFFNSDYLKTDRNVPKKGNLTIPGVTNYYNARLLADKYMNKSRFSLTISFNVTPKGFLLLPGLVIEVPYPRYGWEGKRFRIESLTHQEDCSVDIVAEEYDDSFYAISKLSRQEGSGLGGTGEVTAIAPPTNLSATNNSDGDEVSNGVKVTWTNNPNVSGRNVYTELYSSYSNQLHVTVSSILNNVLTTDIAHNLKTGELITSNSGLNNLSFDKTYYVKEIPSPTTFILSETKTGPIFSVSAGSGLAIRFMTANLLATLPLPTSSYVDSVDAVTNRVTKYYWARHKVLKA